jgi:adenylate cyclase, class 2
MRISAIITVATAHSNSLEIEIKLAVEGPAAARRMLRGKGFHVIRPRVFEANEVFDTRESRLRKSDSLLRVRQIGRRRDALLTFKGPPQSTKYKSREEVEVGADDAPTLAAILGRLGFERVFRYEKYRTEFRRNRTGTVTLDETPIGSYLELEGPPDWIDRTALVLGFAESDYITLSYGRLYLDWCARHGIQPGDMIFRPNVS